MRYSANLLGLEKAAAREIDFGAPGRWMSRTMGDKWFDRPPDNLSLHEFNEIKKKLLDDMSHENMTSQIKNLYPEAAKQGVTGDEFVKMLASGYSTLDDDSAQAIKDTFGLDVNQAIRESRVDTRGQQLPDNQNQIRYLLHSQLGIPINSSSEANIPFMDKLKVQQYRQAIPGLGVAAAATPLASMFSAGAGIGAGLGGAAGTLLGNYIADSSGNHLSDDMRNAGTLGSAIGTLGGAIGGHMLQNSFKGKKKKNNYV